jgi:outer membrane protein assembly factor BamB
MEYDALTGRLLRTIETGIPNLDAPVWLDNNIAYNLRQGRWSDTTLRRSFNELYMWDKSKVSGDDWSTGVVWNISLKQPDGSGPGEGGRSSRLRLIPDAGIVLVHTDGEGRYYAYDLNTGAELWQYDAGFPAMRNLISEGNIVTASDEANMMLHGFKFSRTGVTKLWSVQVGEYPWGVQYVPHTSAYGKQYVGSYDGHVYGINLETGNIDMSFYSGETTELPYGTWAQGCYSSAIADGKLYSGTGEHSPTAPHPRGGKLFCVDAYTGEVIWNITGFGPGWASGMSIAEGYFVATNENDGLMYCIGKGKTATTVSAPDTAQPLGTGLMIKGTVKDMSPAQPGTPAIADEDMTPWVEYLHMQKPKPEDATGVPVKLAYMLPDGSWKDIDEVISDDHGTFGFAWTPPDEGTYLVKALFSGSESYWPSDATTYVEVGAAPPEPATPAGVQEDINEAVDSLNDSFTPLFYGLVVAVVVAIVIGVVNLWVLRKRQ